MSDFNLNDKAHAIDATPTQIHREVMRSEVDVELVGAMREPYGPSGMSTTSLSGGNLGRVEMFSIVVDDM